MVRFIAALAVALIGLGAALFYGDERPGTAAGPADGGRTVAQAAAPAPADATQPQPEPAPDPELSQIRQILEQELVEAAAEPRVLSGAGANRSATVVAAPRSGCWLDGVTAGAGCEDAGGAAHAVGEDLPVTGPESAARVVVIRPRQ
jgi:hypothetical protein